MISLDDKEWLELQDAYGSAKNIPSLLSAAEADPSPKRDGNEEPWFSLWSALCHQDKVYSASFAAVPHLLRIASAAPWPFAWDLIGLSICIEIARVRHNVEIPSNLEREYTAALQQLPDLVCQRAHCDWDHVFTQIGTAALALHNGHIELAEALLELGPTTVQEFLEEHR
jgi:hypothetical protein